MEHVSIMNINMENPHVQLSENHVQRLPENHMQRLLENHVQSWGNNLNSK